MSGEPTSTVVADGIGREGLDGDVIGSHHLQRQLGAAQDRLELSDARTGLAGLPSSDRR